jgi:hypothetical protein
MQNLYRRLLRLYPATYRREYEEEMVSVFRQAQEDVRVSDLTFRASFVIRETIGLMLGAFRERMHASAGVQNWISSRRLDMRPQFRFPRSTVFLMSVILAGVLLAIEKAKTIQVKYGVPDVTSIWRSLPWSLLLGLLFVCVPVAIVWAVLFALRRTGMHRLSDLQTWPEHK